MSLKLSYQNLCLLRVLYFFHNLCSETKVLENSKRIIAGGGEGSG